MEAKQEWQACVKPSSARNAKRKTRKLHEDSFGRKNTKSPIAPSTLPLNCVGLLVVTVCGPAGQLGHVLLEHLLTQCLGQRVCDHAGARAVSA